MRTAFFRVLTFLAMWLLLGAAPDPVFSETPANSSKEILEPIEVQATRSPRSPSNIPGAVNRLNREEIQHHRPTITLEESLSTLPGLFIQNPYNFAQDTRISIRGFGARSPFGVRGIKILVDDIPLTLPDGISQLDSVDPAMVDHIEVLRGPSASLYGNASGGLIALYTDDGPEGPWDFKSRLVFGAFGLFKSQLNVGLRTANTGARVFGSRLEYNGYREHSVTENLLVQSKINWRGGDDSDLMVVIRKFHSPRAEDPGGLTAQQVTLNPRQAHSTNVLFDAGEEVDEETLGLRWRKPLAGRQEWTLSAQVIHRHFSNRLPFTPGGQVKFERWAPGASVKYINNRPWFKKSNRLVAGADVLFQNDDRERFNNHQGVRGATVLKQREIVDSQGIYLRNELLLFDDWELTAGGRYDRIHFRVNDSFFSDGNQSGSRTLSQGSGTLGLLYHITPNSSIYLNGATVFETPTSTELLNNPAGTGGFNPNLDPQTSYSVELGWKGRRVFEYELALFFIRTRDEITPFELAAFPGRTFFRNAGTSERQGVEGRIRWPMTAHWRGTLSYAYSDFEFRDFSVSGVSFAGNRIPGVPRHRVVGQIEYKNPQGWFARGQVERVHRFYVNNESTAQNSGYTASRLELGMEKTWGEMRGGLTFGMGNLLDERYNGNTRINAAGDRFFEPAPPFNLFGGISLSWVPGGQK